MSNTISTMVNGIEYRTNGKAYFAKVIDGKVVTIKKEEYNMALETLRQVEEQERATLVWTVKTDAKGRDIYSVNGKAIFLIENPRNRTGKVSIYIHKRMESTLGEANRSTSQYSRRLRGPKDEVFHIVDQAAQAWANAQKTI